MSRLSLASVAMVLASMKLMANFLVSVASMVVMMMMVVFDRRIIEKRGRVNFMLSL